MKTKVKNIKTRSQVIADLKIEHDETLKKEESDLGNRRVYVNLPVSLLERTAFDIISDKYLNLDQTKVLKRLIHALMRKYPDAVSEAKDIIRNTKEL